MQKDLYIPTEKFTYHLPDNRIAKYPLSKREASKLLLYSNKGIEHTPFSLLPSYLPENSILFFNNTRVIHARLKFKRSTGANIEIFCLSPAQPVDYQLSFSSSGSCSWYCMVGNLKKWKGDILKLSGELNARNFTLQANKIKLDQNGVLVNFKWDSEHSFGEIVEAIGVIPIPPYLNRDSEELDSTRYQTIYSKKDGSVAAPTAGLHFTPEVFEQLKKREISLNELTLHVGAGTFQPLKSKNARDHKMHSEFFTLSVDTIEKFIEEKTTIATGTTTLRTLESLYWLAAKSISENKILTNLNQWEYKQINCPQSKKVIFQKFVNLLKKEKLESFSAYTSIMIVPGYQFKMVDALITNFHQPHSTLLLLIAAFIGEDWNKVYDYALKNEFRFLSYGDSSLLWKA